MARPIKETPVLRGSDAARFEKEIKNNENKKVPSESFHRAMDAYGSIKVKLAR